jgi:hypothetical protein
VPSIIALIIQAARTYETLVNFYPTTRRYNPEDSHLRTHRRENLILPTCRLFENRVLRRIFGPTREEVTECWGNCTVRSFKIVLFTEYYQSDRIKEDEMDGACSRHGRDEKNI